MTSSSRLVRSGPSGSSNSACASDRVLFAREIRWPIVDSVTRNPRAISAVVSPPTKSQRERGPGLGRQSRVAGQEDEPEYVVLDVVDLALDVGHRLLLSPSGMFDLCNLAAEDVGTPEVIDHAPLRRGHQPRDRVVRDARGRPLPKRSDEGVLRQVLGEDHIAGHPGRAPTSRPDSARQAA